MTIEVFFEDPDGRVIYKDKISPLDKGHFAHSTLFSGREPSYESLKPGGTKRFVHVLRNCPTKVVRLIREKSDFAKGGEDSIKIRYSIIGMRVS